MANREEMQSWNYAHDADITFGEVHQSKLPKIILICVILGILILSILAVVFRAYIMDAINNPQVSFKDSVTVNGDGIYEIDYEITNAKFFEPKEYIYGYDSETGEIKGAKYNVEIDSSNFNPNEVGDYSIVYHSSNRVFSQDYTILVHLRDKTAPVITLELDEKAPYHVDLSTSGAYTLTLIRGKDTDKFDPKNYVKTVTDNYSKDENIKIEYPTNIVFTTDTTDIIYTATDEAGNMSTISLTLFIQDDVDAIKEANEQALKEAEEERKRLEDEKKKLQDEKEQREEEDKKKEEENKNNNSKSDNNSSNTDNNNNNNGGNNNGNNNNGGGEQTYTPEPVQPEPEPEPASISASDVTLSLSAIGYDEYQVANACIAAVTYRGSAGSAMPHGMPGFEVPLDPGVYTITWTTTDGLSCTQILTLTE